MQTIRRFSKVIKLLKNRNFFMFEFPNAQLGTAYHYCNNIKFSHIRSSSIGLMAVEIFFRKLTAA